MTSWHDPGGQEGRFGDYFERNGYAAYLAQSYEDVSSENASFPQYEYVSRVVITDELWTDYLARRPLNKP